MYTGSGATKKEHIGITMDRQAAFQFAMEILQHVYRLSRGAPGKAALNFAMEILQGKPTAP